MEDLRTVRKYGIWSKKKQHLVGYVTSANPEYYEGVGVSYQLFDGARNEWLVDCPEHAAWVLRYSTPTYNADYDTPLHLTSLDSDNYEIVEVLVRRRLRSVDVPLPTPEEFYTQSRYWYNEPRSQQQSAIEYAERNETLNQGPYAYSSLVYDYAGWVGDFDPESERYVTWRKKKHLRS